MVGICWVTIIIILIIIVIIMIIMIIKRDQFSGLNQENKELTMVGCERIAFGKNQGEPMQRLLLTNLSWIHHQFFANDQINQFIAFLQSKYSSTLNVYNKMGF